MRWCWLWHDWSRWRDVEHGATAQYCEKRKKQVVNGSYLVQERSCFYCGIKQRREIRD